MLSGRLKKVIGEVVHSDQTCGIPGRMIFQNLNLVRDCLSEIDRLNKRRVLISLDQEKAFDRVDRGFLDQVLAKFGFGTSFRKWMFVLYNNAVASVMCNGDLTECIRLSKGLRQGLNRGYPKTCSIQRGTLAIFSEIYICN